MKIESQVSGMLPELLKSSQPGSISGQPNSFTSEPIGNASEETAQSAVQTTGTESPSASVDIKTAVQEMNGIVQGQKTNVSFSVDEDADETVIKVFDTETGELIRQYPPEEILSMKAKLGQSIGALYDTMV